MTIDFFFSKFYYDQHLSESVKKKKKELKIAEHSKQVFFSFKYL